MKTKLFITILFITLGITSNSANYTLRLVERTKVILFGSLTHGGGRTLDEPFEVSLSQNSIDIYFLQNLSNLTIEVVNESSVQVFYEKSLNPFNGQCLEIGITGWDEGIYTIIFSNNTGGCIYGNFEL